MPLFVMEYECMSNLFVNVLLRMYKAFQLCCDVLLCDVMHVPGIWHALCWGIVTACVRNATAMLAALRMYCWTAAAWSLMVVPQGIAGPAYIM